MRLHNLRKSLFLKTRLIVLFLLFISFGSYARAAEIFTFSAITSNTPEGYMLPTITMIAEEFMLPDSSQGVLFTFGLAGPGYITEIYFDDGDVLSGIETVIDSPPEVYFLSNEDINKGVNPSNLPGGNALSVPFLTTPSLSLQAAGKTQTGLEEGEGLGVAYSFMTGMDYQDVIDALILGCIDPIQAGSLRVGVHVRGLGPDEDFSDSFIAVPTPSAILLGTTGIVFVNWLRKRRVL